MARRTTDQHIREAVTSLEGTMKELGVLPDEYTLRVQLGSKYYGNSNWVAITGGYLGSAVDTIDSLHIGSDATRAQFMAVIKAYHSALYATKLGAVTYALSNHA